MFEIFVGKDNKIRILNDALKSPEVNLNEKIIEECVFD
jgi:hypothetical protein